MSQRPILEASAVLYIKGKWLVKHEMCNTDIKGKRGKITWLLSVDIAGVDR